MLIIAIFIIVVISLLATSLFSLQRDSAQSTSYEVYAARAYLAAYSASEIVLAQLFPLNASDGTTCAAVTTAPALANVKNVDAGFHGCTANVVCSSTPASIGIATRYKIISTAICQNSQIITRRQITVEASNSVRNLAVLNNTLINGKMDHSLNLQGEAPWVLGRGNDRIIYRLQTFD